MTALLRLAVHGLLALFAAAGGLSVYHQAAGAGIATDKPQYLPGETITICYRVPGPGPITITDYSSDGSSAVLAAYDDDGTGDCLSATARGPASTERLVLTWATADDSGSAETTYEVVTAAGTHVLTLADSGSVVTVPTGDRVALALGDVYLWTATVSDPTVLQPASDPPPPGVQGIWTASSAGEATVSAQGDPRCRPQCLIPSRLFSVTIEVVTASAPAGQATATVHGQVVRVASGGAAPPPGTSPRASTSPAGPGIPVFAVDAGDGTATPVATALTDDAGAFVLTLPAGSYWVFIPRAAGESLLRLSAGALQRLPDGTVAVAWQAADLSAVADASVTLTIAIAAPSAGSGGPAPGDPCTRGGRPSPLCPPP